MKFSKKYKLKKDLFKYRTGWTLGWDGSRQKFYPNEIRKCSWEDKTDPDYTLDRSQQGYTVEEIQDTEWFEPIGELEDFIPEFPSIEEIDEFVHLMPECRLVNDVDICRAINELIDDPEFKVSLYNFYKEEYNKFYFYKLID